MKSLASQSHYEVLEVPPDARPEEIERAYRLARATYAEDSIATYSIFGADDAEHIRHRIEEAYEMLSDETARAHYDATLLEQGGAEPSEDSMILPVSYPASVTAALSAAASGASGLAPRAELPAAIEGFEDIDEAGASHDFDGARLRRLRLLRGIELEQIAGVTKVNPSYLRFIEEERYDALPAAVYVRGFVSAYARCLGLDPGDVAASYMERFPSNAARRGTA